MAEYYPNGEEREARLDSRDPAVRRILAALMADARHDRSRVAALTGIPDGQVAARIYRHPEVRSVRLVSGGHDLCIIVEAPTMREIAQFVSEKLAPIDHVTATNTHFLLKAYKEDGDILVEDALADERLPVTP